MARPPRSEQIVNPGLKNPERQVFAQILSRKDPKICPKLPEGISGVPLEFLSYQNSTLSQLIPETPP